MQFKISRNHNHFTCYFQKVLPKWKLNFNPSEQKGQLIVNCCFEHNIMQVTKYTITLCCWSHKTKWALMVVIVYYVNWIGHLPKPVFVVLRNLRRGVNCHLMTNDIYLHNVTWVSWSPYVLVDLYLFASSAQWAWTTLTSLIHQQETWCIPHTRECNEVHVSSTSECFIYHPAPLERS